MNIYLLFIFQNNEVFYWPLAQLQKRTMGKNAQNEASHMYNC